MKQIHFNCTENVTEKETVRLQIVTLGVQTVQVVQNTVNFRNSEYLTVTVYYCGRNPVMYYITHMLGIQCSLLFPIFCFLIYYTVHLYDQPLVWM